MFKILNFKSRQSGFSLVEIILAIALFSIFATGLLGLLYTSYGSDLQSEQKDVATLYADQGLEAVWSIRRQAWNLLANGNHGLTTTNGYWEFSGTSDILEDIYTRVVTVADACRDGSGDLVDCIAPGSSVDVFSKLVISEVTYNAITKINNSVTLTAYLTTWQSEEWTQTNWSGGSGQDIWSDASQYDSDDGNIDSSTGGEFKLALVGGLGCGTKQWPFASPGNYTVSDVADIEVAGGNAQLILSGGGSASGDTLNDQFTTDDSNWVFSTWDTGGGEVDPTGSYQLSGGNTGGYVDIDIPSNAKNDRLGGYWEQLISITENSATVTCSFDWKIDQWVAGNGVDDYQFYVFLDNVSGEPTIGNAIWSSGIQSGITSWSGTQDIDCSSAATTSGTYYYKIAIWLDAKNKNTEPITAGYDNAKVHWEAIGSPSYPTNEPSVNPTSSYAVSGVEQWSSFAETATKDGGEIYYQLSDDDGTTWYYWDGADWASAGATDYNIATVIDTNIISFSVANEKILFKAFLESDGVQDVKLDQIEVTCSKFATWSFSTPENYAVSDPLKIEVVGGVAQLVGSGGSCSGTATACNTYGDQIFCEGQDVCSWTGGAGSCSNVGGGSCSVEPRQSCNDCNTAGCSQSGPNCTGTLDCSSLDESSCNGCGQCSWSAGGGSCSGPAMACNTYGDQTFCEGQDGCGWNAGSYPTDEPFINPTSSYIASGVEQWSSFIETAIKNGGEVYYQLSDDDGTTWYYWDGADWASAGATDYNIATVINTNIISFSVANEKILFKAFLESDGAQFVQLDQVQISWGEGGSGGGYALSGFLISSAFNMSAASSVNIIEWTEVIPACSGTCDVKIQIRTAPDSGGSPGVWTSWYGASGAGTYFTDYTGTVVSSDFNYNQWVQYRVELVGDGATTPILQDIIVNYLP